MRKVLKINAGIACLDRANEVEPRPNEETKARNTKPRRGEMCITDGGAQRNRRYNRGLAMTTLFRHFRPFISFVLFFILLGASLQAQISISPSSNPSSVVVMGDALEFQVNIWSPTAYPNGQLEVTVPAGFKLLPTNIIPSTLASNGLSGRIAANVQASTTLSLTFYVQPLCNAVSGQTIAYELYDNSTATSSIATKTTDPITNFYNPILNVVYPAGMVVNLNTSLMRVIEITQTANSSHVNNLKIEAAADKNGITVSKIEISKDNSTWTDITASGLDLLQNGKYVYTITRANLTSLAYTGNQLQTGAKLYLRETVTLKKCDAGSVNYSVSYGDGVDFCDPLPAANGNITLTVNTPAFGTDILGGSSATWITWPTSPSVDGRWRSQILNTATTDPNAVMRDIYLEFGLGNPYYLKKAYICNTLNQPIYGAGGNTDTIWLDLSPGTGTRQIDINLASTNPAMQTIYESIGFIDADGDGIYNDLNINKTVDIMIIFNITMGSLSTTTCNSYLLISGTGTTGWGYYKLCDNYIRFGRAYGNGGASFYLYGLGVDEIRNSMLTPALVRTGDKATLSFFRYEFNADNFLQSQHGASGTSTYYTDITLPAGLDFDETVTYPVVLKDRDGNVYTTGGNLTWASGYITKYDNQHIRVKLLPRMTNSGSYMEIAVIANGTPDNGSFSSVNLFDYGNVGDFYLFGCRSSAVDYILADNCSEIEMMDFNVERTTFGYTDISKTTLITKADGANVSVIYPFDNVTLSAQMAVRTVSAITPTTALKASASYRSDASGTGNAYLNISSRNQPGELRFFKNGLLTNTLSIPVADIAMRATASGTIYTQFIETDIAKALRNASITQLQVGDSISLVIYARSTGTLPIDNNQAARPVTMTLSKEDGATICYPLIDDQVKFIRYTFDYLQTDNGASQTSWQERTRSTTSDLLYGKDISNINLLTAGEYRPNVDNFSNITFVYNCLIKVTNISLSFDNPLMGNETSRSLAANEYTVTYGSGKTTVVVNPLKDHMFPGTQIYRVGYYLYIHWEAINMSDDFASQKTVSFTSIEYPTSEAPVNRTYNKTIGTDHNSAVRDFYAIKVTSSSPVQTSTTSIVEWSLAIENNSAWVNADPILPYTWIAFETPAGVTPSKLIDVTDNNTVVADIANAGEFISYGSGYYWVKLDSISCPSPRNYKLQCTYTACSGTLSFAAKVGMSKLDYPQDPQNSFAQSPYNSPGMAIHASSSVNLSFTPPAVDFSGALTHQPKNINGTNDFCDVVSFQAKFRNGLTSEISNLKLRVTLPAGFTYDASSPAQVRFGTGAAAAAADVQISSGYLTITLSNTNQVLTAYGTVGDSACVDFRLKISCGAENKRQIYADFIGESGCGAQITKTYNSGQIEIDGMAAMPTYSATVLSAQPTPVYTSAVSPNDGSFTISGGYTRTQLPGGDNCQAIIELPDNLELKTVNSGLAFVQNGTRLTATLLASDNMGQTSDFNLTLAPVNPALWNEDTVKISFFTGIETAKSCDNENCPVLDKSEALDSIKFAMKMLEIHYSDSIVARSRFASTTSEHVEITGWLVNKETTAAFDAGQLTMDLLYRSGASYVPTTANVSGLTVNSVTNNNSTQFTLIADIPNTENICEMLLVLRKTGTGTSNAYLANADTIVVPSPRYEIMTQPSEICQMAVNTSIGEAKITNYTYSWSPSDYLNNANTTPTNFTYGYQSKPVANDTTLIYLVSITRPNGCISTDTIFVPLKGIPSVDVKDTAVCHNTSLNITFTDATNNTPATPTSFSWTVEDVSNTGLPPSGSTAYINAAKLVNSSSAPVTATVTVTPSKNSCDGVDKTFTITVYTPLVAGSISNSNTKTYCYGGIVPTIFLGENSSTGGSGNYTYQWEDSTKQTTWRSISVSDQTYDLNGVLNQTTYYRRVVIDICGTAYSDTITVYPVPVVSGLQNICPGLTTHLTPNANGFWESSDSSVVDIVRNGTIVGIKPGKADLTFYDSLAGGCSSPLTITVNAYPTPDEITGSARVCVGETIELSNTFSDGGVWTKNNDNISFSNSTANKVTVTGKKEGKSFVTYTVSNVGCKTKRTFRVRVTDNTPPKIMIGVER